ncbi:hypothetical protein [Caulobacter sp. FWC2]|uniref:hypothetical protein n=1 Tax=Caulobacter sp. FWC2 TaxID=69664 RepID=UPI000C15C7FD|nr:hypothetical protein [Caulobacter sp. FWC2]PIB91308.1 hypothetical protein CSW62_06785 [Caulobacter sp. FWC2]
MIAAAGIALKEWGLALWSFAKSPLGRRVAVALAVALALWGIHHAGYSAGVKHEQAQYAKALAKAEKKAAETKKKSDAITAKVSTDLATANARIATLSTQLKSEIPRYVTPQADRRCIVSTGYVELRNAAGVGRPAVPEGAGRSLDADSGLVLSDLAENDITNATAFNSAVAEIKAWRDWYTRQADLWKQNYGASTP